jgi:hypothetical protein
MKNEDAGMNEIISFIRRSGFMLNLIVILSWFFRLLFFSIVAAGTAVFMLRLAGFEKIGMIHWMIPVIAGGTAGLIVGWNRRLDAAKTSRWLDDYFKDGDAFSAALFCMERKLSGIYDESVVDRASGIISENRKIVYPKKTLLFRFFSAFMSFVIFFLAIQFMNPVLFSGKTESRTKSINDNIARNDGGTNDFFRKDAESSDLAKKLFPDDMKMSELAEKALNSGDSKMLDELLKREKLKIADMIKNAKNGEEKEKLKKKQEKQNELAESLEKKENKITGENRDKMGGNKERENDDKKQENRENKDERQNVNGRNNGENDSKKNGDDTPQGDSSKSGTKKSDTGTGNGNNDKELETGKNKDELMLSQKKDSSEFEFLLPDKNTKVSLKDVIPDSKRSAESAVTRKGVPVEYEDFVKSYFISLMEEMKNAGQSKDKP